GTYEATDLESRISELIAGYSLSESQKLKDLLSGQQNLQRDANTYVRNAAVFVVAWICARLFLPAGSPLVSIDKVFWPGLLVLVLYLFIVRRRLLFALQIACSQLVQAAAILVRQDDSYAERLALARSNPKPYWELVDSYLNEKRKSSPPSLISRLRSIIV